MQPAAFSFRESAPPLHKATNGGTAPASAIASWLADSVEMLRSVPTVCYDDQMAEELTLAALECGFRNFFASVLARNQKGFARAVKRSGIPRDELFICGSVVSNRAIDEETAYTGLGEPQL